MTRWRPRTPRSLFAGDRPLLACLLTANEGLPDAGYRSHHERSRAPVISECAGKAHSGLRGASTNHSEPQPPFSTARPAGARRSWYVRTQVRVQRPRSSALPHRPGPSYVRDIEERLIQPLHTTHFRQDPLPRRGANLRNRPRGPKLTCVGLGQDPRQVGYTQGLLAVTTNPRRYRPPLRTKLNPRTGGLCRQPPSRTAFRHQLTPISWFGMSPNSHPHMSHRNSIGNATVVRSPGNPPNHSRGERVLPMRPELLNGTPSSHCCWRSCGRWTPKQRVRDYRGRCATGSDGTLVLPTGTCESGGWHRLERTGLIPQRVGNRDPAAVRPAYQLTTSGRQALSDQRAVWEQFSTLSRTADEASMASHHLTPDRPARTPVLEQLPD
jgi:hypothetical protein